MATFVNSGCRCPSRGNAPAASTLGGQLEGPGPISSLLGKSMGLRRALGGADTAPLFLFDDEKAAMLNAKAGLTRPKTRWFRVSFEYKCV